MIDSQIVVSTPPPQKNIGFDFVSLPMIMSIFTGNPSYMIYDIISRAFVGFLDRTVDKSINFMERNDFNFQVNDNPQNRESSIRFGFTSKSYVFDDNSIKFLNDFNNRNKSESYLDVD